MARVAADLRCSTDRLRMLDYNGQAANDATLPTLAEILATCDPWKRARARAHQRQLLVEIR